MSGYEKFFLRDVKSDGTKVVYGGESGGSMAPVKRHEIKATHGIVRDIDPYKSMITGEMIGGRRQHREHLKEHRCIEIGNEFNSLKPQRELSDAPGLARDLVDTMKNGSIDQMTPQMRASAEAIRRAMRK
jgi:hypothetical protein